MRLWKQAVESINGLLGAAPSEMHLDESLEEIRELMLAALEPCGATRSANTVRRVRYAQDLQALWYLRGDVMTALAALYGETQARETMLDISREFDGLLGGLATRPSPLA